MVGLGIDAWNDPLDFNDGLINPDSLSTTPNFFEKCYSTQSLADGIAHRGSSSTT